MFLSNWSIRFEDLVFIHPIYEVSAILMDHFGAWDLETDAWSDFPSFVNCVETCWSQDFRQFLGSNWDFLLDSTNLASISHSASPLCILSVVTKCDLAIARPLTFFLSCQVGNGGDHHIRHRQTVLSGLIMMIMQIVRSVRLYVSLQHWGKWYHFVTSSSMFVLNFAGVWFVYLFSRLPKQLGKTLECLY